MSFFFKLKSHPNKKLFEHLRNVGELSKRIVASKQIENRELFSDIAYLIGICHDFGKATKAFQDKLIAGEDSKYAYHGFLSSLFGYHLIKKYLKERDKIKEFGYILPITWIVINKHHGNIKNIRGTNGEIAKLKDLSELETIKEQIEDITAYNLDEVKEIYKRFLIKLEIQEFFNELKNIERVTKDIYKCAKEICRKKDMKYYFYILFFYSVLLDADKLDASGKEELPERIKNLPENIVDKYKEMKFKIASDREINKIREKAYQDVNSSLPNLDIEKDRILSINLPTGIGKTLTGVSFALKLREKIKNEAGFTPKIIYSLPFLSIIDQNSSILAEILAERCGIKWEDLFKINVQEKESLLKKEIPSNLLLKHHHLADIKYKEEKDNELNIIEDMNKSLLLTEGWHSEIVITTFVQFFHSLITNRNRAARKFHNMVNSIVILDEVQSIPHRYWLLINKVLNYLAKNFNCWIILMTATQPLIFKKGKIKSLVESREEYFESFDRVMFEFDLNEKEFDEFKGEIFNQILKEKNKDIMIVLNTINSCKEMYSYLKEALSAKYGLNSEECLNNDGICDLPDLDLINLSTHILPDFRLRRIKRINQDKDKRKVIVTTQLIEAGVDISVDIIYRDFAPLDCIIQTAGRCNRNDKEEKGLVNVVRLKEENNRAFCYYIYDSTLLDITGEVIKEFGNMVSERAFITNAADKYYTLVVNRGSKDKSEEVMNHIKKLNFSDISEFGLIEEKLPTVSIFVEINDEAKETRRKMEEILKEKKGFERREKLLEIRKNINSFTLSVNCNKKLKDKIDYLPPIGKMEDFRYVPKEDLDRWYKLDVGFQSFESDVSMRIL